jgi:hypothetical protein
MEKMNVQVVTDFKIDEIEMDKLNVDFKQV